jgi:undecaprenyl phosphate-alpha-L-ara4FN deformylase
VQPETVTTRVGLRIDVDTLRGTRLGVPALNATLQQHGILASYFFSVGPDNMGRHLWRLIRPSFLIKMIRSKASSLYGWDILLRGLFWPGPIIGNACREQIVATAKLGHEVGMHAWDHHAWQMRVDTMTETEIDAALSKGVQALANLTDKAPICSASAGWKCNESVLACKEKYGMRYHSDCRGKTIFRPDVAGSATTPQIPVTLPTYDEMIGRDGVNDANFNVRLLDQIRPAALNVLTIHAEVEGIAKNDLFEEFLIEAAARNIEFVPLGSLLPEPHAIPRGRIAQGSVPGRQGQLCVQAS